MPLDITTCVIRPWEPHEAEDITTMRSDKLPDHKFAVHNALSYAEITQLQSTTAKVRAGLGTERMKGFHK